MPVILVLAPQGFARVLGEAVWPGVRVVHHSLPPTANRRSDVYGVEKALRSGELGSPEAVVIVAPRNRSPRTAAPPAVVGDTVVALLQANRPADLERWLQARIPLSTPEPTAAVCSMGKQLFMEVGGRWLSGLAGGGRPVLDRRARRVSRQELCVSLALGPGIVVYAGHGRGRGWSGYQALRWPHIEETPITRPCGLVIALACDTLTRTRGRVAFGSRFVSSGRVGSYVGWSGTLHIEPGLVIADRFCEALSTERPLTPAEVLRAVARETTDPAERRELRRIRLLGDPFTPLWAPGAVTVSAESSRVRAGSHGTKPELATDEISSAAGLTTSGRLR
jgi:hypothetical protein